MESRGGATVYRFTPSSVRRAFDAGWSAAEVHEFLGSISRTAVPQPLSYLVDDTARTFGTLRVGAAEAFLRADDEAALTELLHHPKAGGLGLRRLAPTVLVSSVPSTCCCPGCATSAPGRWSRPPTARSGSPARTSSGPARRAAGARGPAGGPGDLPGDRGRRRRARGRPGRRGAAHPAAEPTSPSGALALLRAAVESGGSVLIGYVDNHGSSSERMVVPLRVEGGQLTAHDHRSDDTRSFAIHRITTVRPVEAGAERRRTVSGWTSSGTPTPRRTWSTPCSPTPTRSARC